MYESLNSKQRDVMIQLLLMANHENRKWEWQGQVFECQPGQFVTSIESLRKHCASDVSTQNIKTALLKLEKWQFLTNKSTKTGRLITICNWTKYQDLENQTNQDTNRQLTNSQPTANQQLTTNKNIKNDKEGKEVKKYNGKFVPPTVEEVREYCQKRGNGIDPEQFVDSYTAKGWMIGKNKMQDWRASVRTWEKTSFKNKPDTCIPSGAENAI